MRACRFGIPAFAGLWYMAAAAQAGEEESLAGLVAERATYWEVLLTHGWQINLVLGILAFFALFLFFHVMLVTRRRLTVPPGLYQEILDDIASGDIERAGQRAGKHRSLLGRVALPALRLHDRPLDRLQQVTEGAGRRAVGALRRRANYLANIGAISPMLGLLGTILGMVTAFESFSAELEVSAKQAMLTAAIGKALITTAVGLVVGIPSMAAYYYISGRINRISDELELAVETVVATLKESR